MMHGSTCIVFNTSYSAKDILGTEDTSENSDDKMNAIWAEFRATHVEKGSRRTSRNPSLANRSRSNVHADSRTHSSINSDSENNSKSRKR